MIVKLKRAVGTLPAIFMMCFIFLMSAQPADKSSSISTSFTKEIEIVVKVITNQDWTQEEMDLVAQERDKPIRKIAHMTEYALLTLSFMLALYMWEIRDKRLYIISFICSVAYAFSDEFHQSFVEGRYDSLVDVAIDSCGALIAVLIILAIANRQKRKCLTVKG
ncbi:VanZ like family protein [Lachnospiraceae bacterium KH1T2]|nr:VanZ like family protein [Lachnospiraceae bacterium KH1T2]